MMSSAKLAISMEKQLVKKIDALVKSRVFPNRSQAIQKAVEEKVARIEQHRLARECAKLNPKFEQQMAEEGLGSELDQWPEY